MTSPSRLVLVAALFSASSFAGAPEPLRWQWQDEDLTYTLTSSIQGVNHRISDPVVGHADVADLHVALRLRCRALGEKRGGTQVGCAIEDIGLEGTTGLPAEASRVVGAQELDTTLARWEEDLRGQSVRLTWGHDGALDKIRLPASTRIVRAGSEHWGRGSIPLRDLLVPVLASLELALPQELLPVADSSAEGARWVQRNPLAMMQTAAAEQNLVGDMHAEHLLQARDGDRLHIVSRGAGAQVSTLLDADLPPHIAALAATHVNVGFTSEAIFDAAAGRLLERTTTTRADVRLRVGGAVDSRSTAVRQSTQHTRVQLIAAGES